MELDADRIDQDVPALLSLGRHEGCWVWEDFDWAVMHQLHEHGDITDPISKAKTVQGRGARPALRQCLKMLEARDTLIVCKLDRRGRSRRGRSLRDLIHTLDDLKQRGARFCSLAEGSSERRSTLLALPWALSAITLRYNIAMLPHRGAESRERR
jgi:hypothetical protein